MAGNIINRDPALIAQPIICSDLSETIPRFAYSLRYFSIRSQVLELICQNDQVFGTATKYQLKAYSSLMYAFKAAR